MKQSFKKAIALTLVSVVLGGMSIYSFADEFATLTKPLATALKPLTGASEEIAEPVLKFKELPQSKKLHSFEAEAFMNEESSNIAMAESTPGSEPIYGVMMYSSAWGEEAAAKRGIYSIPTDGSSYEPKAVSLNTIFSDCGFAVGVPGKYLYGKLGRSGTVILSHVMYSYNTSDWSAISTTLAGDISNRNFIASDCAYNPVTANVYGSIINGSLNEWGFYRIATETKLEFKKLATLEEPFVAMSFDKNGLLYAVTQSGKFIKYDITTFTPTVIAEGMPVSTKYTSGTLDKSEKKFYYAQCKDGASTLYSIDVATGAASKMFDFSNGEEFVGLYIPSAGVNGAVPTAAKSLTATFTGPDLTGKFAFTAPDGNVDTSAGSGELDYTVFAGLEKVGEGKVEYGKTVTLDVTLPRAGEYTFTVRLKNVIGEGEIAKLSKWIGPDIARQLTTAPTVTWANGVATIKWYAPLSTSGVNGGYVDRTKFTYNIIRNNDGKVVGQGITTTTINDELPEPEEATLYTYSVSTTYEGTTSQPMISAGVVVGPIVPAFTYDFNVDPMPYFSYLDANKDSKYWMYSSVYKRVHVNYNATKDQDDWLFTKPIKLLANHVYTLTYNVYGGAANKENKMEVKLGKEATVEGMTVLLQDTLTYSNVEKTPLTVTNKISVTEDGRYYIGFHGVSPMNNNYNCINYVSISAGTSIYSPKEVTEFTVTPDINGELKGEVSLVAPTQNFSGDALKSLSSIIVRAGGEVVATIANPEPGKNYSAQFTVKESGTTEFQAVAINEAGESQAVSATAYMGLTVPYSPDVATLKENTPGNVTFNWSEVKKDANGKNLDPASLTYVVMELDQTQFKWLERAAGIKGLTHTMQLIKEDEEQDFLTLAIGADNQYGRSKYRAIDQVPIGKPYYLPFVESNTNNMLEHTFLTKKYNGEGLVRWYQANNSTIEGMVPYDGDNGYFYMTGDNVGDKAGLLSGKVSLENVKNPVLSIAYVGFKDDKNIAGINVIVDGVEKLLKEWECSGENAWYRMDIPLDEYKGKTIQFVMYGELKTSKNVFTDRIEICDYPDKDVAISSFTAPQNIRAGRSGVVTAVVANQGIAPVEGYTVTFYSNNKEIGSVSPQNAIPFKGGMRFELDLDATPMSDEVLNVYAEVTYPGDMVAENNRSETKKIDIVVSELPAPEHLTAYLAQDGNSVNLNWDEPTTAGLKNVEVLDDCEDYESFSISNFGDWTTIDADKSKSNAFSGITVPHMGTESFGFMVFDTSSSSFNSTFNGTSGNKYFMAFTNEAQKNDDWLISPELSGEAQNVSFFARGYHPSYPEAFQVLYSTAGKEIADFKLLNVYENVGYTFNEYKVAIPEGAKYFAIRCVSENGMMFIVDDISYTPNVENVKVTGYNLYRGGELIKSNISGKTHVDTTAKPGKLTYNVSAVYAYGESKVSNTATLEMSDVEELAAQNISVKAIAQSIEVIAPLGSEVSVYSTAGLKLFEETTSGKSAFSVETGVYVVKVDSHVYKVAVK